MGRVLPFIFVLLSFVTAAVYQAQTERNRNASANMEFPITLGARAPRPPEDPVIAAPPIVATAQLSPIRVSQNSH